MRLQTGKPCRRLFQKPRIRRRRRRKSPRRDNNHLKKDPEAMAMRIMKRKLI